MDVLAIHGDVLEVSLINITSVDIVLSESLVVGDGPGGSRHNSKLMVSIRVNRSKKGVLG